MADLIQVEGARINALVTLSDGFQLDGARINALVTLSNGVQLDGARIHALVAGPLTAYVAGASGPRPRTQGTRLTKPSAQGRRLT